MYINLSVTIDDQVYTIKAINNRLFRRLVTMQKSVKSLENLLSKCQQKINLLTDNSAFKIDSSAVVLDIGSGIGLEDLFLQQYTGATFYLLDQDVVEHKNEYQDYSSAYNYYNKRNCTIDMIESTGLDKSKFKFVNPADNLPNSFDVIMSNSSWCWHYPLDVYWDKVKNSLKSEGTLLLDISNRAIIDNPELISTISEEFNFSPWVYYYRYHHVEDNKNLSWINGTCGVFAVWKNRRTS